jgi:UMF1 family MFS transporter
MLSKIFGRGNVKQGLGWALYDFANSSYSVLILSFVFPVFYREAIVGKAGAIYWDL